MMETLRKIWELIAPYFSGSLAGAIIACIVLPFIKGTITKTTEKLNVQGIMDKVYSAIDDAVNKAVDRIKNLAFKQSIQPIVKSELEKVTERANSYIEGEVSDIRDGNDKIVAALSALGAYFDDSIVPDAKKQAFYAAIASAKSPVTEQEITVEEITVEATTAAPAAKKYTKKSEVIR